MPIWKASACLTGKKRAWALEPSVRVMLIGRNNLCKFKLSHFFKVFKIRFRPWYFNTQNWPHASCVGGCGTHRNLQETHEVVNKCYKIEGTEYPTCGGKPPRTQAEKDAGTAGRLDSFFLTRTDFLYFYVLKTPF